MRYETYEENYSWQAGFIDQVRAILGSLFVEEAPIELDRTAGTDLIILRMGEIRISVRLRRSKYLATHPDDVTITCRRETGARVEWHKIILDTKADWLFYGFVDNNDARTGKVVRWRLIDLAETREYFKANAGREFPNKGKPGSGNRCWFYPFNVYRLGMEVGPKAFVDFRPRWPGDLIPRKKKMEHQTRLWGEGAETPEENPATEQQIVILRGLAQDRRWGADEEKVRAWVESRIESRMTRYEASVDINKLRDSLSKRTEEDAA